MGAQEACTPGSTALILRGATRTDFSNCSRLRMAPSPSRRSPQARLRSGSFILFWGSVSALALPLAAGRPRVALGRVHSSKKESTPSRWQTARAVRFQAEPDAGGLGGAGAAVSSGGGALFQAELGPTGKSSIRHLEGAQMDEQDHYCAEHPRSPRSRENGSR